MSIRLTKVEPAKLGDKVEKRILDCTYDVECPLEPGIGLSCGVTLRINRIGADTVYTANVVMDNCDADDPVEALAKLGRWCEALSKELAIRSEQDRVPLY